MVSSNSSHDDPIKIFLLSVSVFCFTFSFLIMLALCYRQAQRIAAVNEVGNLEVHLRSGFVWLTGSQRQAEKIDLILQRLHAERRTKIMDELSDNKMLVTEKDLIMKNQHFSQVCDDDDLDQCLFVIPPPFKRKQPSTSTIDTNISNSTDDDSSDTTGNAEKDIEIGENKVEDDRLKIEGKDLKLEPGECAICLSTYKVGDVLLWSQNNECNHCFHRDCILTWLMKKQSVECPCCRREFLDHTSQLNTLK